MMEPLRSSAKSFFQPFSKMAAKILAIAAVQKTTYIFASYCHKRVIFVPKHKF